MRIGIDAHMIGDRSGGNENYYYNILKTLDPGKHEVFIFVQKRAYVIEYNNRLKVVCFRTKNAFVRNFIEIPILCVRYKLDIMHMQCFVPFIRPCLFVCVIHDICFEHFDNIFGKMDLLRQKLLIPFSARKSKIIYTVSEYSKNDIVSHYRVSRDKILVSYNAVNENFKPLSSELINAKELRERYGIGDSLYILCVGNLQPRKNLVGLIKAFSKFKDTDKYDTRLVIVGKRAWMYNDILHEALSNRYSSDIIFTDYVSEIDLVRLYNEATMFIYPSFFEGFGVPPLEAMACGTPVAVSNTSSLPEVVGDAGLYFDPYSIDEICNAICMLMNNKELRDRLTNLGLEQASKFNWMSAAEVWKKGYLLAKEAD